MKIFAFYEPLGDAGVRADAECLLAMWKRAWAACGFTPVVIGLKDIHANPKFWPLMAKANSLPTVNGVKFDGLCFARWAISHLPMDDRAGILADYDVFPRPGFELPRDQFIESRLDLITFPAPVAINGDIRMGAGFMMAKPEGFDELVDRMLAYEPEPDDLHNGQPHVSDMIVLRKRQDRVKAFDWVRRYRTEGWEKAPILHFGNDDMAKPGTCPKWLEIAQVMGYDTSVHACSSLVDTVNSGHEQSEPGHS